jgi:hypothetical protein
MKTTILFTACSAALLTMHSAHGQGTFQDLNFEAAILSPILTGQFGGEVPITTALPGWSGSIANLAVTQVLQNNEDFGTATIDIFGPNWGPSGPLPGLQTGVIDGNYTVFLQSGANPQGGSVGVNTSISQNGTIPANAQSLEFKTWSYYNSSFSVSFAGNSLSLVFLGSGPNYDLYGVNVASYAGQTGPLEFTSIFKGLGQSCTEFDDITFSPNAIPEPGTLALVVLGGLAFGVRAGRKRGS